MAYEWIMPTLGRFISTSMQSVKSLTMNNNHVDKWITGAELNGYTVQHVQQTTPRLLCLG